MAAMLRTFGIRTLSLLLLAAPLDAVRADGPPKVDAAGWPNAVQQVAHGRNTFRFDTFGDQDFWGGALRLHEAIAGAPNGGVGPGVSPKAALGLGLKVDAKALPAPLVAALAAGRVNLDDPAVTVALLARNAVVGVRGFVDRSGRLESVGITCALCHSTVDDSLAPGIGARLDGWANRDLNVGAIVASAPSVAPFAQLLGVSEAVVRKVFMSWGPGKFDAALLLDGKAFRPDGRSAATLIPPAFGLAGVNSHTFPAGGPCRIGTRSSPCSRCKAKARSTIRAWTTPRSFPSPRPTASATCAASRTS
jgi:hypothetical protein